MKIKRPERLQNNKAVINALIKARELLIKQTQEIEPVIGCQTSKGFKYLTISEFKKEFNVPN